MRARLSAVGRDTFSSLRIRNFRLFFVGQGISQIGNWMTLVVQALLVLELTDSGVALGLLAAAQFGPVLLLGPWAGLVADRSDKRRLLMRVQSVAMAQSAALAALALSGRATVGLVYALAVVGGVTVAFDNPARRALVVEMVPAGDVPNAVSLNSAMMTSSRVVGPALAGVLVVAGGFGWAFLLDAVSYVPVLVSLAMMRPAEMHPAPVSPRGRGQMRDGFRYVRSEPVLWVPLVMMAVVGTLAFNFATVVPLFVTRDLGGTASEFTLLFSLISLGSLAGALAVARRRDVTVRAVALWSVAFGMAIVLFAASPGWWMAVPAGIAVGITSIGFLTSSTSIVQLGAVPEMRGRVLALQAVLFLGTTPMGGPVVGWVAEEVGARAGLLLGAVACLGAGAWGMAVAGRAPEEHMGCAIDETGMATPSPVT
jgi:MFS family permease